MNFSEKASILGDFRELLQDFLAPEMGELKAKLNALCDGQKLIVDGQREMESRLMREIRGSEEKLLWRIQLAEASLRMERAMRGHEEALRTIEQLKREKAQ